MKKTNSRANCNVLFRSPKGHESHAQITAFEDTWHWGEQAAAEFNELIHQPNTDVAGYPWRNSIDVRGSKLESPHYATTTYSNCNWRAPG